jgi:hypothetical protein
MHIWFFVGLLVACGRSVLTSTATACMQCTCHAEILYALIANAMAMHAMAMHQIAKRIRLMEVHSHVACADSLFCG